jgi:hypothetical protein
VKIKLRETQVVDVEIEVTLPLYRKHVLDGETIYMRVDETEEISVHVGARHREVYYEISKQPIGSYWNASRDYALGQGAFESSAVEFYTAVSKAASFVTSIPGGVL